MSDKLSATDLKALIASYEANPSLLFCKEVVACLRDYEQLKSWQVVATDCIGKYEESLQEAEAILGGEYDINHGPLFELVMEARSLSNQCFPQPTEGSHS